ncbi:MAG TPA: hypothetical protein VMH31_06855 [Methylomirabilota bacterium]|nr:hypothetical protein [Methylomirabilota bacterium]
MAKIAFFVDGFNLYHALDYTESGPDHHRFRKYKWLNLRALAGLFVGPLDSLEAVFLVELLQFSVLYGTAIFLSDCLNSS